MSGSVDALPATAIPEWSYDEAFYRQLIAGWPLDIRTDPVKGKGLFAAEALPEGAVLLRERALACCQNLDEFLEGRPVCGLCLRSLEQPSAVLARVGAEAATAAAKAEVNDEGDEPAATAVTLPIINALCGSAAELAAAVGYAPPAPVPCCGGNPGSAAAVRAGQAPSTAIPNGGESVLDSIAAGRCRTQYCSTACRDADWTDGGHAALCPAAMAPAARTALREFCAAGWTCRGIDLTDTHFLALRFLAATMTRYASAMAAAREGAAPLELLAAAFAPVGQLIRAPIGKFFFTYLLAGDFFDTKSQEKGCEESAGGSTTAAVGGELTPREYDPDDVAEATVAYRHFVRYRDAAGGQATDPIARTADLENGPAMRPAAVASRGLELLEGIFGWGPLEAGFFAAPPSGTSGVAEASAADPELSGAGASRWAELLGAVLLNGQERSSNSPFVELIDSARVGGVPPYAAAAVPRDHAAAAAKTTPESADGAVAIPQMPQARGLRTAVRTALGHAAAAEAEASSHGQGVYAVGACFNHSCRPNIVVTYADRNDETLVVTALRPLRRGEELCISYIDEAMPRPRRQQQLYEHYLFSCRCQLCEAEQ